MRARGGQGFPEVQLDDLLVGASTAHLERSPERFDVLVATNFYGDIISGAGERALEQPWFGRVRDGKQHTLLCPSPTWFSP